MLAEPGLYTVLVLAGKVTVLAYPDTRLVDTRETVTVAALWVW